MSHTFNIIKEAIMNKKQVTAMYEGYHREFCPHILGYGKDGLETCLVYQFGGDTSRGRIISDTKDNWKCMKLDKFSNIQLRDGVWHTFGNHSEEQTCIKSIDTQI